MGFGAKGRIAIVALMATLAPAIAGAEAPIEPIRTDVRAVAACSDDAAFLAGVRARTASVRRAQPSEEARTFHVAVTLEGDRFVGRLTIEERGHASRPRQVSAMACDDVVSALALIAALAIDPNADATPPAAQGAPPPSTPPTQPAAPTPTQTPIQTPITPARTPPDKPPAEPLASAAPPERDRPLPRLSSPPNATRPIWTLGAILDALAVGTVPVPRAGLQLRRTWESGASLGLAPSVASGYRSVDGGGARLLWATATFDACPFRWAVASAVSLSPCVLVEAGVLTVSGANVPAPTIQTRPWLSLGALARAEVPLGGRLVAEAHVGLAVPPVRDTFYFLPATSAYQPPNVVGWGGIAAAVSFP